jgi:hypothetical protein
MSCDPYPTEFTVVFNTLDGGVIPLPASQTGSLSPSPIGPPDFQEEIAGTGTVTTQYLTESGGLALTFATSIDTIGCYDLAATAQKLGRQLKVSGEGQVWQKPQIYAPTAQPIACLPTPTGGVGSTGGVQPGGTTTDVQPTDGPPETAPIYCQPWQNQYEIDADKITDCALGDPVPQPTPSPVPPAPEPSPIPL